MTINDYGFLGKDIKQYEIKQGENKGTVLCLTIPYWYYKLSVGEFICQG